MPPADPVRRCRLTGENRLAWNSLYHNVYCLSIDYHLIVDISMTIISKAETPGAVAAWRISMGIMTLVMSALLALILAGINTTNNIAQDARNVNNKQDQDIILLQARLESLQSQTTSQQRVSDATVASLQTLMLQLTRAEDKM